MTYEAEFFISEHWKVHVDIENAKKKKKKVHQKVYGFSDNFSSIGNGKFSLLLRKYSSLAVNVLTRSPKISDLIKKIFFELTLAQIDEKIESKYFSAYIWGFWDKLAL